MSIAIDCTFDPNGSVRVRRVEIDDRWQTVEQGRQWLDQDGRHVLIMLDGRHVREIVLRRDTLSWEIDPGRQRPQVV